MFGSWDLCQAEVSTFCVWVHFVLFLEICFALTVLFVVNKLQLLLNLVNLVHWVGIDVGGVSIGDPIVPTTSVITGVFGDVTNCFCGVMVGDLGLPIIAGICGVVADDKLAKSRAAAVFGELVRISALVIGDCGMTHTDCVVL